MAKTLNIYQKLAKIRKQVEVIQKDRSGYGYKYVSDEEILAKLTAFLDKYNLSLIPSIVSGTTTVAPYTYEKTKTNKKGDIYNEINNEVIVNAEMCWTWVNNDDPEERLQIPWILVGQQNDASQAFGSALTYSQRYFLLKFFSVATPESDPDNFRSKQKAAETAEDRMIAAEIIEMLDKEVRDFLNAHPGKGDDVKKLAENYVKDGDYWIIKESKLASKLLSEFRDTFTNGI